MNILELPPNFQVIYIKKKDGYCGWKWLILVINQRENIIIADYEKHTHLDLSISSPFCRMEDCMEDTGPRPTWVKETGIIQI